MIRGAKMLEYSKLIEETEKAISWIKEFVKKKRCKWSSYWK